MMGFSALNVKVYRQAPGLKTERDGQTQSFCLGDSPESTRLDRSLSLAS